MGNFKPLTSVVDGITRKLSETFGDGYTIYPEVVKQGRVNPCFFIRLQGANKTLFRDGTYHLENSFCIHYFSKSTNQAYAECQEILEELHFALELIEVNGNPVRGIKMRGDFHDETLMFYVDYNLFVREVSPQEKMEELKPINITTGSSTDNATNGP